MTVAPVDHGRQRQPIIAPHTFRIAQSYPSARLWQARRISVDPSRCRDWGRHGVSRRQNVPKLFALRARRLIEVTVESALRLNRRLRAPTVGHDGPLENPRKILDVRLR